ncbi:Pantoate--beta-alanine ligase [Fulvivirga imtechensis AK7]|uniref:Pantothenate synthetase n=1 Tax=Fulvivirga imtechensis AK7 TaxID=1237149 RepID=L8JRF6_9BACT|nr:pantoate--beta-alanine ligase [Fulvivirga imtechensis]ELR69942.1 Pantoate--beta-alanine ligase [Fulvivirga imtechensis AK7]
MEVYKDITPLQHYLNEHKFHGKKIGLVPTMGALHEGHLSLVRASQSDNDVTVCSIYVNPTQFNNDQDLAKYPRTLDDDLTMLREVGCDAVFCPSDQVMYIEPSRTRLLFDRLDHIMEGKFRPGHFSGVGLVVSKLFNIVAPDRAYFGQKDLQQFVIIQQLVKDLSFNVELKRVPIIRENDGLAMSSRNRRLGKEGRGKAVILYKALTEAQKMLKVPVAIEQVKQEVRGMVEQAGVQLEYFEVIDPDTLTAVTNISEKNNVALCVAGYVDGVRLIDNVVF